LVFGCVAPQSQSLGGYALSSRLAKNQFWRSAGVGIYLSQYLISKPVSFESCV
jgi:hypothetical protein